MGVKGTFLGHRGMSRYDPEADIELRLRRARRN